MSAIVGGLFKAVAKQYKGVVAARCAAMGEWKLPAGARGSGAETGALADALRLYSSDGLLRSIQNGAQLPH